jgi:hypothetical protein
MFRHIVCHPQRALSVLAKITCKTRTLHSVKGVAAYHGFACAVCSVCACCARMYVDSRPITLTEYVVWPVFPNEYVSRQTLQMGDLPVRKLYIWYTIGINLNDSFINILWFTADKWKWKQSYTKVLLKQLWRGTDTNQEHFQSRGLQQVAGRISP